MEKIAIVGAGLVGRAWAIVFARAGYPVVLYDTNPDTIMIRSKLSRAASTICRNSV